MRACGHPTARGDPHPPVTGNYDYLLEVEVAGLPAYEDFHANQLAWLPCVATVTGYVTMKTLSAGELCSRARCACCRNLMDWVDEDSAASCAAGT
ncbi:Lrp/AsnC ligand binding domain-containing protein [Streptomyces sp. NPDC059679]|uniref:Lrp/AsnC ligand binding domain-containing protein n=1 Tax=Streptomyces sp. NPDC059679 TaxID=3346903 RepID=UPI003695465E